MEQDDAQRDQRRRLDRLGGGQLPITPSHGNEFRRSQPFAGLLIGTAIHLEPKTAALLLTLQAGGATVCATGNLNSTQIETVDELRERGIDVIGEPTSDPARHAGFLDALLAHTPDLLLDNGGDLFARVVERPYARLLGGTEETTESMDLGFTLQARCLEAIARGEVGADACVVPVPAAIDAQVAGAYLALARGT